jgi:hypothetical protein
MAATGATLAALRAGETAATIVTARPARPATMAVLAEKTIPPAGGEPDRDTVEGPHLGLALAVDLDRVHGPGRSFLRHLRADGWGDGGHRTPFRRRERDAHVTTPVGLTVDRAIPQRAAIRLRLSSPGHGS